MKKVFVLCIVVLMHISIFAQAKIEIIGNITIEPLAGQRRVTIVSGGTLQCNTLTIAGGVQSIQLTKDLKIFCNNIIFDPLAPAVISDIPVTGNGFTLTIETATGGMPNTRRFIPEQTIKVSYLTH